MPGFVVTRGLGGTPSSMIAIGFLGITRKIIKGATRFAKRVAAEISETLKISVMLLNTNGKELSKPIFNKVTKTYNTSSDIEIKVLPKKLIARRAKKPKVTAKLRKYNDEQN